MEANVTFRFFKQDSNNELQPAPIVHFSHFFYLLIIILLVLTPILTS